MSLRRKLLTAFGAMALLALLMAGTTLWATFIWYATSGDLQAHYQRSLLLQQIRADTFRAAKEASDVVVGDPNARREFAAIRAQIEADFLTWSKLADSEPERAQVRQVRTEFNALARDAAAVFALVGQQRAREAASLPEMQLEDQDVPPFQQVLDAAVESDRADRQIIGERVMAVRATSQLVVIIAGVGLISISVLVLMYLASDLFAPLRYLQHGLAAITVGDFGVLLDPDRRDELGEVNRTFNTLSAAAAQHMQNHLGDDAVPVDGESSCDADECQLIQIMPAIPFPADRLQAGLVTQERPGNGYSAEGRE